MHPVMIPGEHACNFCGRSEFRLLFHARDLNRRVTDEQFGIYECKSCGLVITYPLPEDLSKYYPAPYYHTRKKFDPVKNLLKHKRVLAKLKHYKSGGRLLDVGCNIGSLAKAAADSKFQASGIDISADAVSYAREELLVDAHCGDFSTYPFPEEAFDVITLSHVLEHARDPKDTLSRAYRSLKQDGVLFLAVPDFDSLQSGLFRQRWFHLDVPRHTCHFRREVLAAVLLETGFRIESVEQGPEHFDRTGFRGSVVNLVPFRVFRGIAKKIAPLLAGPFLARARRSNRAASFEIIARK